MTRCRLCKALVTLANRRTAAVPDAPGTVGMSLCCLHQATDTTKTRTARTLTDSCSNIPVRFTTVPVLHHALCNGGEKGKHTIEDRTAYPVFVTRSLFSSCKSPAG